MKAATGELNLTLITIVAIGLVGALFYTVLWPGIKDKLTNEWGNNSNQTGDVGYVEVYNTNLYN